MSDPALGVVEVFVGVDIAKGDHYACALTAAGEAVLAAAWPTTRRRSTNSSTMLPPTARSRW